jgi:hypothetical protein
LIVVSSINFIKLPLRLVAAVTTGFLFPANNF